MRPCWSVAYDPAGVLRTLATLLECWMQQSTPTVHTHSCVPSPPSIPLQPGTKHQAGRQGAGRGRPARLIGRGRAANSTHQRGHVARRSHLLKPLQLRPLRTIQRRSREYDVAKGMPKTQSTEVNMPEHPWFQTTQSTEVDAGTPLVPEHTPAHCMHHAAGHLRHWWA